MKNQMEGLNKAQKAIVLEYEDHLSKLQAEVRLINNQVFCIELTSLCLCTIFQQGITLIHVVAVWLL